MTASSPSFPGLSFRRSHPELDFHESRPSIRPTPPTIPSATPPQRPRRRRAARFALGIAAGLGLSTVFVSSFAAMLLVHLNAPAARRAVAAVATDFASRDLRGTVTIASIDRISPTAIDLGEITVRDPNGVPVISAYGAHVRFSPLTLLKKKIVDRVVIDRVNVAWMPSLVDAVSLKVETPPKGPAEKSPSTFAMAIPSIDVRVIEAWGQQGNTWMHAYGEIERTGVRIAPEGLAVTVPRVTVHATAPVAASVDLDAALRIPNHQAIGDLPVVVDRARVRIETGGAHATITATTDERSYHARIVAPSVSPGAIAALTGAPPTVPAPASIAVDVRGTMDEAAIDGVVGIGASSATIHARADLVRADAEAAVALRGIDPSMFGGPPLGVSADLIARAKSTPKGTEVTLTADGTTTLSGQAGSLDVDARALIAPNKSIDASGTVHAGLGRAKADVAFNLTQRRADGLAHATVTATAPALEDLRAIHEQPLKGRVDLEGAIDVDLGKQTFALQARAHAIGFRHPSVALPEGAVAVHGEGTLREPKLVAAVVARQIVLTPDAKNPYRLHDVDVRVAGTPKLLAVSGKLTTDASQKITASTHLAGTRLIGTKLHLERDAFVAEIAVKEVSLDQGTIAVQGLRMSSTAGGLRLDASYDPKRHRITLDAASTPLDLPALLHGAGIDGTDIRGTLTIDAKLATIPRKSPVDGSESGILELTDDAPRSPRIPTVTSPYVTGHVKLDLDDGYAPKVGELNAHVDVDVEDRLVLGDAGIAIKDLLGVGVHGGALVPGRIDDPKAWQDAAGHVDLRIPTVDLSKLAKLVEGAPEMIGTVDIDGHLERRDKSAPPNGWVTLDTHGLGVQSGATRIEGIDLRLRAALDGERDHDGALRSDKPVRLFAVAEARDARGPLLMVHAGTEGLWKKIQAGVADLPFVFDMIAPPRDLALYPRSIAKSIPVHGKLGMAAHGEGTLGAPRLDLRARLEEVGSSEGSVHDAEVTLTYDGALAKLMTTVIGRREPEKKLLALDGELAIRSQDLLAGGAVPWTAKLDAKLDGLPLDLVVVDSGISGQAKGEVHVAHVNDPAAKSATVDGRIDLEKFKVGDALFDQTYVTVKVDDQAATATAAVHGRDGALDARARIPLLWKNAASVTAAPGQPIEATLDARDLRLKIAEPFVTAVDHLDGKLNAHVTARVTRRSDGHYDGAPEGSITLREGEIIADAVGERWRDVEADLKFHDNRVDLSRLHLHGRTGGSAEMKASATLDGFFPETLHAQIDTKRFSFASEGARVGDLTGTIKIDGKRVPLADGRKQMVVDVTLEPLTIDLAAEAGKQVQQLDPDPSIVVMQAIAPPIDPPPPAGSGTPMKVIVHIPHPLLVRRDDLRVAVSGNPSIDVDGPAKFAGEVRIDANPASNLQQRSWVEVMGKRFYIQQSRIAFQGNEEFDPTVDVEVRWQAPDRTIVQIRVTGRLKTPKVTFKALDESGHPMGLTQGEVMSLLVLGRRDAGSAQQQQAAEKGAAAQTASLVQGMTGAILGKQLQKMLPASMSLSLAPGRYSGGYQHDNVYFEVAYNSAGARMGPQAIGQTVPRTTFGIEWRFAKMWSLMTTIGDTGSTLVDLLWHYRY